MRRLLITGVVTAATFVAVVIPASASFDSHFAVISETVQSHRTDDGFRFREHLFQIDNPSNRVGRDKGGCAQRPHRKIKCKVLVHLNGEVGGFGDLRVSGNFGPWGQPPQRHRRHRRLRGRRGQGRALGTARTDAHVLAGRLNLV